MKKFDLNQDGGAAVNEMRGHYDEPEATEKRLFKALAELKQIHHKSEHALPFDSYIAKLQSVFFRLSMCERPKTQQEQVDVFITRIKNDNSGLTAAKQIIMMNPLTKNSFKLASDQLSERVADIFRASHLAVGGGKYRKISGARSDRGGRSRGRGGRGGGRGGGRDEQDIQPECHTGNEVPEKRLGPHGGRNGRHQGLL